MGARGRHARPPSTRRGAAATQSWSKYARRQKFESQRPGFGACRRRVPLLPSANRSINPGRLEGKAPSIPRRIISPRPDSIPLPAAFGAIGRIEGRDARESATLRPMVGGFLDKDNQKGAAPCCQVLWLGPLLVAFSRARAGWAAIGHLLGGGGSSCCATARF